ncbi:MAG: glycosyltransferase, partial [Clostridia bacterium]|nr:glycosyltransferase [Clostridia bacterium]
MLAVIIPAYNEQATVARTVAAARRVPVVEEVIVVDDGSRDETAAQAKQAGATVLRLPYNCGKGHALNCGYRATRAP